MTSRERVLAALAREAPDRTPWIEIEFSTEAASGIMGVEFPAERLSRGSVGLPEDQFLAVLDMWIAVAKRVGLDAVGMFYWSPVFAERGQAADGTGMEIGGRIGSLADLEEITADIRQPNSPAQIERGKLFAERVHEAGLAAFFTASFPLDVAMRSVGLERFCIALFDDPELIAGVLDWFTDFTIRNVRDLADMGIDLIWIADDMAYNTGPMVSPAVFAEVMMPRYRKIAAQISIPWIYHSDGNLLPVIDDLVSLGMSALHPIQPEAMDIFALKRDYGDRIALVGNVSIDILTRGTPDEVRAAVGELSNRLGLGGHLFSSSNAIVSYLDPENVVAMGEAVRGVF